MQKKRTIYTIAEELNISPATISKVINNTGKVSEETRRRVNEYIKEVGYVPTMSARMLKSRSTKTIGVVFSEELNIGLEHSFFSSILQHFKSYVENMGYELSFIVSKLGEHKQSYLDWCINKRVDGVYIVVGNYQDQGLIELINSSIPCISTDMMIDGLHTVVSDNDLAVKKVFEFVYQKLNKRKVAMIVGPQSSKGFEERYYAYMSHAKKYEMNVDNMISFAQGFGFNSGYQATLDLIKHKKTDADVIFVSSDDLALGTLKALKDLNISVPQDIQVIGFDDLPVAKFVTPALTTVQQNRKQLGEEAAKKLLSLIENKNSNIQKVTKIDVEIIERESTKR